MHLTFKHFISPLPYFIDDLTLYGDLWELLSEYNAYISLHSVSNIITIKKRHASGCPLIIHNYAIRAIIICCMYTAPITIRIIAALNNSRCNSFF